MFRVMDRCLMKRQMMSNYVVGFCVKDDRENHVKYGKNIAKNVEGYCANQWNDITLVSVFRKEEIRSSSPLCEVVLTMAKMIVIEERSQLS